MRSIFNAVIGTAGHVDHGKSSLVKSLTSIDPDRLPEEKAREMTIDIGFANMTLRNGLKVGIIDVPGHEDFIKNMLAGATGVDFVILIVDAVEGVMPQTIEHMRIMELLGLKKGVVVITKKDLTTNPAVDGVKNLVKGTFLEGSKMVLVSNKTGEGISELYDVIDNQISNLKTKEQNSLFRMYIQRVFTKKGFGTVITGVPVSGKLSVGEDVEIVQLGKIFKVKTLHAYQSEVDMVSAGHSSAINIGSCDIGDIARGFVAATPGYYAPIKSLYVEFTFIEDSRNYLPKGMVKIRSGFPIKFYTGTVEVDGKILFYDQSFVSPGDKIFARINLADPIVVQEGDRYIIRTQSPVFTVGGGVVVYTTGLKLKKNEITEFMSGKLLSLNNSHSSIDFIIRNHASGMSLTVEQVSKISHVSIEQVYAFVHDKRSDLVFIDHGRFIHTEAKNKAKALVVDYIRRFHAQNKSKGGILFTDLCKVLKFDETITKLVVSELLSEGIVSSAGAVLKLSDFAPSLVKEESELYLLLEKEMEAAGIQTLSLDELLAKYMKYKPSKLTAMLDLLIQEGKLIRLKNEVILHRSTIKNAMVKLFDALSNNKEGLEPARIRDVLNTSRKYVIPLLEYFDSIKFTKRVDNRRVLYGKDVNGFVV